VLKVLVLLSTTPLAGCGADATTDTTPTQQRASPASMGSPYIYGMHEPGGESLMANAGHRGWILFYEPLHANTTPRRDFTAWSSQGYGVVVRVDNSWEPGQGTLPCESSHEAFADEVASYIQSTTGASIFVIGNETNMFGAFTNWPLCNGALEPITVDRYVSFFRRLRGKVQALGRGDWLIPAPAAPQDYGGVHGVDYQAEVLAKLGPGGFDGIAMHAYTDGRDPALVTSEETTNSAAGPRHKHFRVYRDMLAAVPSWARSLPVFITETCPWPGGWAQTNTGWIQRMYAEIHAWNRTPGNQRVTAAMLYRWPNYDEAGMETNPGAQADFSAALAFGYRWDGTSVNPPTDPSPPSCPCLAEHNNYCLYPVATPGCAMTQPGGYCDPDGNGYVDDADWVRGYQEYQQSCGAQPVTPWPSCPCLAEHNNYCLYPVATPGCAMTQPGGYCDPDGNGYVDDADWVRGYQEYQQSCGAQPVTPWPSCPCLAEHNNYCLYPVATPGCAMTQPGGYCDPDGNGYVDDADWVRGYQEYQQSCGK
jgi:hypothetical protein